MTRSKIETLPISDTLALPLDAATQTFGILATKGAGKSNAAVVMAEAMWDAGVPWVAIDPKGDWWGMRSSADGKGAGLPIVVFGGRHGDLPLEPTAGQLVAALVLERRLTCVLDVSQFNKAEQVRFLLAFGTHLFKHADDDGPEPLHLFLEEAHEYLPQQVSGDVAHLVNAWQRIVKQGRFKGLGCTLISQRSSALNKDVLELVDTLIVLRTGGPLSRKSIKAWVDGQDVDPALLDSLPTLGDGEAWIWSPGVLKLTERTQFRRRRTFDSGATPKIGEARRAPATLADVDLAELKELMAETIERAQADDPKALRRRIVELERQLASRPVEETVREVEVRVEVPVIEDIVAETMVALIGRLDKALALIPATPIANRQVTAPPTRPAVAKPQVATAREPRPTTTPRSDSASGLSKAERAVLTVLVQHPGGRTRQQLTMLSGYTYSGGFRNTLSALRTAGLMVGGNQEIMRATDVGIEALGDYDPLPTGDALLAHWLVSLSKSEALVLRALVDCYPEARIGTELADAAGYEYSGGFRNALSRLRTLELISGTNGGGMTASADLLDAIR